MAAFVRICHGRTLSEVEKCSLLKEIDFKHEYFISRVFVFCSEKYFFFHIFRFLTNKYSDRMSEGQNMTLINQNRFYQIMRGNNDIKEIQDY